MAPVLSATYPLYLDSGAMRIRIGIYLLWRTGPLDGNRGARKLRRSRRLPGPFCGVGRRCFIREPRWARSRSVTSNEMERTVPEHETPLITRRLPRGSSSRSDFGLATNRLRISPLIGDLLAGILVNERRVRKTLLAPE
jgi:hypothetical protein